jgi:hypothetical protein
MMPAELTINQLEEVLTRADHNTLTDGQIVLTTSAEAPGGSGVEGNLIAEHPIDGKVKEYSLGDVRVMHNHLLKQDLVGSGEEGPTKEELQAELRKRHLPVTGSKEELRKRLEDHIESSQEAPSAG